MATQEEEQQEEQQNSLTNSEPIENLDTQVHPLSSSLLNLLPTSQTSKHDRQTFRTALVHSAALLFVFVCGICALYAYRVLEPFLRSMLWSILAGAFLFPLKTQMTDAAQKSLNHLEKHSYLLIYGLFIILPLKTIDRTIESIYPLCCRHWKELSLIGLFLGIKFYLLTNNTYQWCLLISNNFVEKFLFLVRPFDSPYITTLILAYSIAVLFMYNHSPLVKMILNLFAIPVWLILLIYLSQFLPVNYRLIVIFLAISLTFIGFVVDVRETIERNPSQDDERLRRKSIFTNLVNFFQRFQTTNNSVSVERKSTASSSTPYFTFIFWSLIAIKIYQFGYYLAFLVILVPSYLLIKYLLIQLSTYLIQQESIKKLAETVRNYFLERQDVLMPPPLQSLTRFLTKGDKKLNQGLQASIDYLVTALMIVILLISVLFGSIFLIIQIQHESVQMVKLTGDIVNETLSMNPSFQHMLPQREYMSDLINKTMNNVYSVGRTWIVKQINSLNQNEEFNSKLEKDVLQLWDNLYDYMSNTSNVMLPNQNHSLQMYALANHTMLMSDFSFHLTDLYYLIQNNLGILRTILDSIWTNTTLLLTLISTIFSLVFTGSFALLNFVVSFIVFVTVLFYLLSNSNKKIYRPTEWLNSTLAVGGKNLGKAVNESVTSVFVASLKIAAFYGLYTYVLHTIVGSNLIFLPAVIASICAVTLKSYWAALPGCLDLWLVQQRPIGALILLVGQIAPVYVVDTAIYSEVKGGGHQYLTALAIAGGVYYRGMEGALIGPIVLCCLLVGVRLYNETMEISLDTNDEQESMIQSSNEKKKIRLRSGSLPE